MVFFSSSTMDEIIYILLLGVDYFRHSSCYFFSELHVTNFDTTHDAMHYAITHFVEGLVHGFLYNICWLDDIFLEKTRC